MSYLLDTNVLSELIRPHPYAAVVKWIEVMPEETLYVSVLTLGEIRRGIEKIQDDLRKEKIRLWLETELPQRFENRILSVDKLIADRWGRLVAEMGRPLPAVDSLIAATALHYDLRLVTRNERDFKYPTLQIINPWK